MSTSIRAMPTVDLECPMCGAKADTESITNTPSRLVKLRQHLEELSTRNLKIEELRGEMEQMCAHCQALLAGISSETDRLELQDRIKRAIAEFEAEAKESHNDPLKNDPLKTVA